jgi:hypothetical protein
VILPSHNVYIHVSKLNAVNHKYVHNFISQLLNNKNKLEKKEETRYLTLFLPVMWRYNWMSATCNPIQRHHDFRLPSFRAVRNRFVDKAPSLWYLLQQPEMTKHCIYFFIVRCEKLEEWYPVAIKEPSNNIPEVWLRVLTYFQQVQCRKEEE